ncbi:MAG TPA: sugar phosphate nucleotidyltransferase [Candidatus Saccharimonadales bacterium]|nr:sugar phosphate nucleotidyltransferase [Candidatus Saccharimonadales bacterium]
MADVTRAIILLAGYGTRRLPITKAVEKCMLPIGNRPIVDYVVEDCIRAGVTDITFVVSEQSQQLRTYYGTNQNLHDYLERVGKHQHIETILEPSQKATFHYVVQTPDMPYGTAVPVALCADLVKDGEQVIVASGDDFEFNRGNGSELARLIQGAKAAGATAGLLATNVPREQTGNYGVIALDEQGGFKQIIEKPDPANAPSTLVNISKYLFDKRLFDLTKQVMKEPPAPNGEYQVTNALDKYVAEGNALPVVPIKGTYLDGGTLEGWLHANNVVVGGAPLAAALAA